MARFRENTRKDGGILTPTHQKTTVTDTKTGKQGVGRSYDRNESIDRAWKDHREKTGNNSKK
ncbi:MAG: hypothetical protein DDT18_00739 [Actinobacteria bacterium]|nr:hypothetical protein [Actinomycetota bacterium]